MRHLPDPAGILACQRRPQSQHVDFPAGVEAAAVFAPLHALGLVVVDEEHDNAYKQDGGVHYHARDMAVVRGNLGKIPVILASATPSIESHVNARTGRYRHVVLPGRFSGVDRPCGTSPSPCSAAIRATSSR